MEIAKIVKKFLEDQGVTVPIYTNHMPDSPVEMLAITTRPGTLEPRSQRGQYQEYPAVQIWSRAATQGTALANMEQAIQILVDAYRETVTVDGEDPVELHAAHRAGTMATIGTDLRLSGRQFSYTQDFRFTIGGI